MLSTYGAKINSLLNGVGLQVVRRATLDRLLSERDREAPAIDAAPSHPETTELDGALRFNEASHNFRKVPRNGEPVEAVPVWYLQNLQRESLALRDATAELVRLRLELANAAASPSSPGPAPAQQQDGLYTPVYDHWGLRTDPAIVHNHDFMRDPRFVAAYERGAVAEGYDPKYFWRTHVALWCARVAMALGGDFVECGLLDCTARVLVGRRKPANGAGVGSLC